MKTILKLCDKANKVKTFKILLIITLFFLFSSPVLSVGISPSKITLPYEPGSVHTFEITIKSNMKRAMDVILSKEIDHLYCCAQVPENEEQKFLDAVQIPTDKIYLVPYASAVITVTVKTPEFETPGKHVVLVKAIESLSGGGSMGGRSAVRMPILVEVPYPGKYLVLTLNKPSVKVNEPLNFEITAVNKGKEHIVSANPTIHTYYRNGTFIKSFELPAKPVDALSKVVFNKEWNPYPLLKEGEYKWNVTIIYDEHVVSGRSDFRIGILNFLITNYKKQFIERRVNPLFIQVKSMWTNTIKDVYADIVVYSRGGRNISIDYIKTPVFDFRSWEEKNLTSTYWDTKTFQKGFYNATITLYYADKTTVKDVVLEIIAPPPPVKEKPKFVLFSATNILIFILIIIIAFNIMLFMKLKKKKAREDEEEHSYSDETGESANAYYGGGKGSGGGQNSGVQEIRKSADEFGINEDLKAIDHKKEPYYSDESDNNRGGL